MIYTPGGAQDEMIELMLWHARVALWAQMGLGKTSSVLTALHNLEPIEPVYPALVVAPKRVARSTWPGEIVKWDHLSGLRASVVIGSEHNRIKALQRKAEIYTINYDNLLWLREMLGKRWPFKTVIADESTRLKGFRLRQGSVRAKALAEVAHNATPRFIELTGTPSPNGLKDLWGQVWYLDRGDRLHKSYAQFSNRWFETNPVTGVMMPKSFAEHQITELCSDICFSFRSEDYFDIDKPAVFDRFVDLPGKHKDAYAKLEREFFLRLSQDEKVTIMNAQTASAKLSQYAQGAIYRADNDGKKLDDFAELHDQKIQELESIKEEAAGMPLLVAYWFKHDLARLKKAFPKAVELTDDPEVENAWNRGEIEMLLVHYQSAAHGLNLQWGSNIVVIFTPIWNLELYEQVIERVGPVRQAQAGLDRGTNVYRILCRGTVDMVMANRLTEKKSVQDTLMAAARNRIF